MSAPEFSRPVDVRQADGRVIELAATAEERAALAKRFALVAIERLEAALALTPAGDVVEAAGRLRAAIVQVCAISGEDLPVTIDEPLALRFVPETPIEDEELELDETKLDEIPYDGQSVDLGEAVAQSLALAIDPYATGPEADVVRKEILADESASGPFAALAALKKD